MVVLGTSWTGHVLSAVCKLWKSDHRLPLQRGGDLGVFLVDRSCLDQVFQL
jgi:hypothetical protein